MTSIAATNKRTCTASAPASSVANKKKSKTEEAKTPYKIYFAAQTEFLNQNKHLLGQMLIKGISPAGSESEDEEEQQQQQQDNSKYTTEQMNTLRCIMITQNRNDQLDQMQELILGDEANQSMMLFGTSFSYDVADSWATIKKKLARKTPAQKLDMLMAYTYIIKRYDTWMHDNEGGMEVLVKGLAGTWKKLLKDNSDEALGWDLEYTKPGILEMLAQFKSAVEGIASDHSGLGQFKYN
ncbi:MAG: hypothetical protein SGBAC_009487 [Bacillariaceae sp.]